MMEIIAERTLEIELPGEAGPKPIRIVLGKPEASDDGSWFVPYEIHGPGEHETLEQTAHGVDALQALALVLYILPEVMKRYEGRGRITDHGKLGFSLGLPSGI